MILKILSGRVDDFCLHRQVVGQTGEFDLRDRIDPRSVERDPGFNVVARVSVHVAVVAGAFP